MDIPIYKAMITDNEEGITAISFVTEPAVETRFLRFNKQKKTQYFNIIDNENRKVIAPIMRCDFPIYRYDADFGEYYVIYSKEVIEKMARKMLADNICYNMNEQHNPDKKMNGVYLEELFIKNVEKGINPKGFEDVENFSLFGVYTIKNNDVWDAIERGEFNGISLEGVFTFECDEVNEWQEIYNLLKECAKQGIK